MVLIPNYPDYLINEFGYIFSIKSNKWIKTYRRMKYIRVPLSSKNIPKHFSVHRLVAQCFIPNPENKPFINHIDGNPQNNHVSNLEWCTRSENIRHAFKLGLIKPRKGEDHPMYGKKYPERGLKQLGANNPSATAVKCLNNEQIFSTVKSAADWCNADSSTIIRVCKKLPNRLGNPCLTAGKHPLTKEALKWEYI